ncbi:transmembrane protein 182-like [Pristis pectinata]|uniref:transmembrane protein 182-like n=1 Tax=Pristis pectinata TaxID=685728 RepID=UPI00223E1D1B|nr:transmembrane protein 182-like [Pristis pectinata]
MKVKVVAFVGGFIGAIGLLLFLVALGTDYWLLATENCDVYEQSSETNQPPSKYCVHGYLFPFPIVMGPVFSHDSSAVYRGFWTAFIIVGVAAGLVGGLLLVCAVSFASAKCYKVGGGFLLASGILFSILIFLFVMWKEFVVDLEKYILLERSSSCQNIQVNVQYGWSFMFAAAGIPLALLAGLLFYLIGTTVEAHNK